MKTRGRIEIHAAGRIRAQQAGTVPRTLKMHPQGGFYYIKPRTLLVDAFLLGTGGVAFWFLKRVW